MQGSRLCHNKYSPRYPVVNPTFPVMDVAEIDFRAHSNFVTFQWNPTADTRIEETKEHSLESATVESNAYHLVAVLFLIKPHLNFVMWHSVCVEFFILFLNVDKQIHINIFLFVCSFVNGKHGRIPGRFCCLYWMLSKFLLKINSGNVRPAFLLFTAQTSAEIGSGRFLMWKGNEDPQDRGPNQNFKLDIFHENSTHPPKAFN